MVSDHSVRQKQRDLGKRGQDQPAYPHGQPLTRVPARRRVAIDS